MALITLDRATELVPNFPSSDNTVMQDCVNAASDLIERHCNRTFGLMAWDEVFDGQGGTDYRLTNYPVVEIDQVMWAYQGVIQIRNTDQRVQRASFRMDGDTSTPSKPNNLYLVSLKNGITTSHTINLSTTVTFSDLANAINAFASDGWAALALAPYTTWAVADLYPMQGAKECRWFGNAYISHHIWNLAEYQFNQDIGELVSPQGFDFGYRNYRVKYTAGYSTVPYPIQQACAALAVSVYNSRTINANVTSENLGGYSYSNIAEKNFHSLDIASRYALAEYKSHRVAKFKVSV
jgi:hypothetical protein